jgi:hypothetical protein
MGHRTRVRWSGGCRSQPTPRAGAWRVRRPQPVVPRRAGSRTSLAANPCHRKGGSGSPSPRSIATAPATRWARWLFRSRSTRPAGRWPGQRGSRRAEERAASLRQESSGKEDVLDALKPFIAALRVTNPARESLASDRKRVLRRVWQRTGRSVNSQSQSRCLVVKTRSLPAGLPRRRGLSIRAGRGRPRGPCRPHTPPVTPARVLRATAGPAPRAVAVGDCSASSPRPMWSDRSATRLRCPAVSPAGPALTAPTPCYTRPPSRWGAVHSPLAAYGGPLETFGRIGGG